MSTWEEVERDIDFLEQSIEIAFDLERTADLEEAEQGDQTLLAGSVEETRLYKIFDLFGMIREEVNNLKRSFEVDAVDSSEESD